MRRCQATAFRQTVHHGGRRNFATALHRNPRGRKQHEDMGFHDGWGTVATRMTDCIKATMMRGAEPRSLRTGVRSPAAGCRVFGTHSK